MFQFNGFQLILSKIVISHSQTHTQQANIHMYADINIRIRHYKCRWCQFHGLKYEHGLCVYVYMCVAINSHRANNNSNKISVEIVWTHISEKIAVHRHHFIRTKMRTQIEWKPRERTEYRKIVLWIELNNFDLFISSSFVVCDCDCCICCWLWPFIHCVVRIPTKFTIRHSYTFFL